MSNHRTHTALSSIIGLAEGLTVKLPAAQDHLLREMRNLDGYTTGSDAPKVKATSELTGVERTASQRMHLQERLDALNAEINAVVLVLRNLHSDCDRIIQTRIEKDRCTGGQGRDGNIEWGKADCWEIPAHAGLCVGCYHRERRWRKDHGLPTREVA